MNVLEFRIEEACVMIVELPYGLLLRVHSPSNPQFSYKFSFHSNFCTGK